MERKLQDMELGQVTGGDGILAELKSLQGENDDYRVAPSDHVQELIAKYQQDKKRKSEIIEEIRVC